LFIFFPFDAGLFEYGGRFSVFREKPFLFSFDAAETQGAFRIVFSGLFPCKPLVLICRGLYFFQPCPRVFTGVFCPFPGFPLLQLLQK